LQTVLASGNGAAIVVPTITKCNAEAAAVFVTKFNTGATGFAVDTPMHTITAGGQQARPGTPTTQGLVTAFLAKHYGGVVGAVLRQPIGTVTTVDHHSLVAAYVSKMRGDNIGDGADEPLHTISAGGTHHVTVAALLLKYYGNERDGVEISGPMHTIPTRDRFGLVTVQIQGEPYVITDIGMRMLQPHELYAAQGFPPDYQITKRADGASLPKSSQVRMCGNSVCPPLAKALVQSNYLVLPQRKAA
jgi:DNA (cytosine-5)-methyltransferase 1